MYCLLCALEFRIPAAALHIVVLDDLRRLLEEFECVAHQVRHAHALHVQDRHQLAVVLVGLDLRPNILHDSVVGILF